MTGSAPKRARRGLLYMQTSQQAATEQVYAQHLQANLVISSPAGGLPLGLAAQVSRLPGVVASPLVTSNGFVDLPPGAQDDGNPNSTPLLGLDGATASRVANYQVTSGSLARLSGNTIAIPASWVKSGQEVGDTLMLRFGDNTVTRLRRLPRAAPARRTARTAHDQRAGRTDSRKHRAEYRPELARAHP
jgi:putative ABC transport system permease protein